MERGESDLAEADFNRAIEMSRTIGYRHGEAVYQMNLGILLVIKGRLGTALRAFEGAAATYSDIANGRGRALVLANSAWIRHANLGDNAVGDATSLKPMPSTSRSVTSVGVRTAWRCLAASRLRRVWLRKGWPYSRTEWH